MEQRRRRPSGIRIRRRPDSARLPGAPGLQELLDSAPDAMIVSRRNGRILMANAQAARLFGYSADELLGERVDTLVPNLLPATSSRRGTGPARPGGEGRPDVPGPSSEAGRAGAGGGVRGGLARELHEGTAQRLAALAMRLASPAQASRGSPRRADERWARHAPSPDSAWARFAASPSRSASAPPPIRASAL